MKFQNQESSEEILIRAINLASLSKTSLGEEEEKNGVEKKGLGDTPSKMKFLLMLITFLGGMLVGLKLEHPYPLE